ncbi:MAG: DUF2752 domain-containing protein [Actinomycetes bacterium]
MHAPVDGASGPAPEPYAHPAGQPFPQPAPVRTGRWHRVGAVACGCALAGAAVAVALIDPSSPDSPFPGCAFRAATGLWCPGCGLTRATHHLLTGDPLAAIAANVFAPFVLLAIVAAWVTWTAATFGRRLPNPFLRIPTWASTTLIVTILAFGVVRNVPAEPWSWLAP